MKIEMMMMVKITVIFIITSTMRIMTVVIITIIIVVMMIIIMMMTIAPSVLKIIRILTLTIVLMYYSDYGIKIDLDNFKFNLILFAFSKNAQLS